MVRGTCLEIDVIARLDDAAATPITDADGRSVGVRRGDWVFLSAVDDPQAADDAGCAVQTERIIAALEASAGLAGTALEQAAKAEVFLRSAGDQPAFERAWGRRFGDGGPAKVVVPSVGLRRGAARVEVALTLLAGESELPLYAVHTDDAPAPLGSGPQAVRAGDLLFFSTQLAADSTGGLAVGMSRADAFPWYGSPGRAQMRYLLDNVSAICAAAGTSLDRLVRRVCYHNDLQWFGESIDEWASQLPGVKPVSTTLQVAGPLGVPGANTLLDLIAWLG